MKQKNFTFKQYKNITVRDDYISPSHFTIEDEMKEKLLRSGYIIKEVSRVKTISINCVVARANIPLKERRKLQIDIDKESK